MFPECEVWNQYHTNVLTNAYRKFGSITHLLQFQYRKPRQKEMAIPQPFFISGDNEDDLQVCCNISEHRLWDNWGFCIGIVSGFPSSNFLHSFIFTYWMKHIYVKLDRHLHVFFKFPYQWHCSFWIAHRQQWAMLFIWKCLQKERDIYIYIYIRLVLPAADVLLHCS